MESDKESDIKEHDDETTRRDDEIARKDDETTDRHQEMKRKYCTMTVLKTIRYTG